MSDVGTERNMVFWPAVYRRQRWCTMVETWQKGIQYVQLWF